MPVLNEEVAEMFQNMADLLSIKGENPFRVRAYQNAARTIGGLSVNVRDLVEKDADLTKYPGIGDDLASKIKEIVETGELRKLEKLKESVNPGLIELLKIDGLGPKRVKTLREELDVESKEALRKAADEGRVREVEGFGEKTERKILESLDRMTSSSKRFSVAKAERVAEPLIDHLRRSKLVGDVVVAGSYRRRKGTVGDLDLVATGDDGKKVVRRFTNYENVDRVVSKGDTRSTIILRSGLQVDLRVVEKQSFGAALMYLTGSKPHNVALREIAVKRNRKINEYGVYKGNERVGGETEEEIYDMFGLATVPPELREDNGEIEAALQGRLPDLITLDDLRGDLQSHTTASDGKNSAREMAEAAVELGREYLAVTDHSKRITVANGLDEKRLAKQIKDIDRLNDELDDIVLLKSVEVDILENGSLDLDEEILNELDVVTASIHSKFDLPPDEQTDRVIKAMDHQCVNILAHPTGRMIGQREPCQMDMERLFKETADRGCVLEINSQPDRLDLHEGFARSAKQAGVKLSISTDAHTTEGLKLLRFGVDVARRGWLEADDVVNTRPLNELRKLLKRS